MNPWLGIGTVLLALGTLFGALRLTGHKLAPEVSRKATHVGMGLVCLGLPWMFTETWPVLLLAGLAVAGLGALRWLAPVRARFGAVLGGVERVSFGEFYFPVAVALVFMLSQGNALLFCVPVLMLTLADTTGALVGGNYGQHRYETSDGTRKSWEGSVAFFSVAFICAHVPVLLFTSVGRLESLLIGVLLAGVVVLAEAAAWRGLDNLFIPLAAYALLKDYLHFDADVLGQRALMLLAVLTLALWLRHRLTLNGGALALAVILCYVCGALGGWHWLLAPVTVFLGYATSFSRRPNTEQRRHSVEGVLCVATGALFWAFAAQETQRPDLIYPFTVWIAANFSIIVAAQTAFDVPQRALWKILAASTLWPFALCLLPFALLASPSSGWAWLFAGLAVPLVMLSALVFFLLEPNPREARLTLQRWLLQGIVAFTVSGLAWLSLSIPLLIQ